MPLPCDIIMGERYFSFGGISMKPVTRVYLCGGEGERIFGEGPCRLLRRVERTGSLRAAAGEMGLAYTKALKMLRRAEAALGFPLTAASAGGRGGGGSRLTAEGRDLLERYERYRDACYRANEELFHEYFSG